MILVVDNYDSFTYNLVQYLGELGEEIVVRRNDQVTIKEIENDIRPDRVLLSPGPGEPNQAGIILELIAHFAARIPILGVCLGHQAIAKTFGGQVVRARLPVHGKSSEIRHDGKTIFRGLEHCFKAGRYHSLIVDAVAFPASLEISATTSDGLIMGLRHRRFRVEGVQFHPESVLTTEGKKLLANFLKL